MNSKMEYFMAIAILTLFGFVFVDDREAIILVLIVFIYCAAKIIKLAEQIELQARKIEELKEKVGDDSSEI